MLSRSPNAVVIDRARAGQFVFNPSNITAPNGTVVTFDFSGVCVSRAPSLYVCETGRADPPPAQAREPQRDAVELREPVPAARGRVRLGLDPEPEPGRGRDVEPDHHRESARHTAQRD